MLIDEIYEYLGGSSDENHNISFGLSDGNVCLPFNTPNLWGRDPAVYDYYPCSTAFLNEIEKVIGAATTTVDIATLTPLPDVLFLLHLKNGLLQAAANNRNLVVRILIGAYYHELLGIRAKMEAWVHSLELPDSVSVYLAASQPAWISWNHSKLIIVDGATVVFGGHNMWTNTYCDFAPIHDVSVMMVGPGAAVAQNFLNLQWSNIAKTSRTSSGLEWTYSTARLNGVFVPNALATIALEPAAAIAIGVKVLAVGRLGSGLVAPSPSANASRTARIEAVRRAKRSVKFSQQTLGGIVKGGGWDDELMAALARCIATQVEVTIIISDTGAANGSGQPYAGYGVDDTALELRRLVASLTGLSGPSLTRLMEQYAHVGPVRQYPRQPGDPAAESWKWRKSGSKPVEPGNHAKTYIIDDETYYVGSDNAYPIPLNEDGHMEFGYLIAGAEVTKTFLITYFDVFWGYSSAFQFTDWSRP
jgi:phosphatidylserine/phosphatidylglycerophosphate/cardiolipin synthase-like enzyme